MGGPRGLSIFGTALASFAATRDTIQQDRRNTERYSSTAKTLGELKRKLPEVAHDIQGGASEALDGYVAVVCDLLSSENKQWTDESEKTRLAVEDLEKLLSDARSRADERAKAPGPTCPNNSSREQTGTKKINLLQGGGLCCNTLPLSWSDGQVVGTFPCRNPTRTHW